MDDDSESSNITKRKMLKYMKKNGFFSPINDDCYAIKFVAKFMRHIIRIIYVFYELFELHNLPNNDAVFVELLEDNLKMNNLWNKLRKIFETPVFSQKDKFGIFEIVPSKRNNFSKLSEYKEFNKNTRCVATTEILLFLLFGKISKIGKKIIQYQSIAHLIFKTKVKFNYLETKKGILELSILLISKKNANRIIDSHSFMIAKKNNNEYMVIQSDYYNISLSEMMTSYQENVYIDSVKLDQIKNWFHNFDKKKNPCEYLEVLFRLLLGDLVNIVCKDNPDADTIIWDIDFHEQKLNESLCYSYIYDFLYFSKYIFIDKASTIMPLLQQKINFTFSSPPPPPPPYNRSLNGLPPQQQPRQQQQSPPEYGKPFYIHNPQLSEPRATNQMYFYGEPDDPDYIITEIQEHIRIMLSSLYTLNILTQYN
jgi:hypothetical protein